MRWPSSWANGLEWMLGADAGDPATISSAGPGYVYAASNLTNLFNRPDIWSPADRATDITQATRSIVWFNNDYIVVYDRATSLGSGLFKTFQSAPGDQPRDQRQRGHRDPGSGQLLFIQTLLPLNTVASSIYGAGNLNSIAELEPRPVYLHRAGPGQSHRHPLPPRAAGRQSGHSDSTGALSAKHRQRGL